MRNMWQLLKGDLKRLTSNVVTAIIVLGLVFIPSIFSWYNILASWDVFDNTGNLKVAVANTDMGYQSDLMPLRVNIGDQVVSALRQNDQLSWTFTDEEDAIDGTRSGKYYAAVVIPGSFSRDMMTFYSDDVEHAQIVYYTNEKKSAVAPKVTDQGADQVSYQINQVFTETLAESALNISSALSNYADSSDVNGRVGDLANHVGTMSTQMAQAASVLKTYSSLLATSRSLVSGSANLLGQARDATDQVEGTAAQGESAVSSISDAMLTSSGELSAALKQTSAVYAGISSSIDQAFASTDQLTTATAKQLRDQAKAADAQVANYQAIIDVLKAGTFPSQYQPTVDALITQMEAAIEQQKALSSSLNSAADKIEAGDTDAQAQYAEAKRLAEQAQQSVTEVSDTYETDIKPQLEELSSEVSALVASLEGSASNLDAVTYDLQGSSESISTQLSDAQQQLDEAAADLTASSQKLSTLSQNITAALSSGDTQLLRQVLSADPEALAAALAAPVQLDRNAVFPADNFGSQMAPLYTTLAIWIGSLLLCVAIQVVVPRKERDQLDDPKPRELFLGRFGVFGVLSLAQTTVMALGNMLFLGVQANHPFLYLLCFWLAGLVFTFIIYALVVSFANLGKAIAVLLLIIQVTAGGGSFPLPMLPDFIQAMSPYLPATHVINAMRAAMMGVYQNDFWIEMGQLLVFVIPFALLGLALRKPLTRFLRWYVRKVEDSKLVS